MSNWKNVNLSKWPAMVVVGNSVTPEQAKIILVRTMSPYISTNDRVFEADINRAMGIKDSQSEARYESIREVSKRYGMLNLEYLQNHQVASCYIGGPHRS